MAEKMTRRTFMKSAAAAAAAISLSGVLVGCGSSGQPAQNEVRRLVHLSLQVYDVKGNVGGTVSRKWKQWQSSLATVKLHYDAGSSSW